MTRPAKLPIDLVAWLIAKVSGSPLKVGTERYSRNILAKKSSKFLETLPRRHSLGELLMVHVFLDFEEKSLEDELCAMRLITSHSSNSNESRIRKATPNPSMATFKKNIEEESKQRPKNWPELLSNRVRRNKVGSKGELKTFLRTFSESFPTLFWDSDYFLKKGFTSYNHTLSSTKLIRLHHL